MIHRRVKFVNNSSSFLATLHNDLDIVQKISKHPSGVVCLVVKTPRISHLDTVFVREGNPHADRAEMSETNTISEENGVQPLAPIEYLVAEFSADRYDFATLKYASQVVSDRGDHEELWEELEDDFLYLEQALKVNLLTLPIRRLPWPTPIH